MRWHVDGGIHNTYTHAQNHTGVRWVTQFNPHVRHAGPPPRSPPPHATTGKEKEKEDTVDYRGREK